MPAIVVATDGSEGANRAVDYAARRAKQYNAELVILNVIGGYGLPDKLVRMFAQAQNAWLQEELTSISAEIVVKARDRAREIGAGTIKLDSRSGDVAQTILDVARENHAEAIVVGKRGAGPVEGLLLGSVSQKLVLLSHVPVTVVP